MAERTTQLTVNRSQFTENQTANKRPILGYDQFFPVYDYQGLRQEKPTLPTQEFLRRKNQLDQRHGHNLETALGERFNLAISQIEYCLKDGQLVSIEHDEPFLEVIKRGQKYRQENNSNDIERELAEVEGFKKVQKILSNPECQDAKIIIISPRGQKDSMYQHNFFDIYVRQGNKVIMHRFASKSTWQEFLQAANELDPFNNLKSNPQDADFLGNPLITYQSMEQILALLNLDRNTMSPEEYQQLIEIIAKLKLNYINALSSGSFEEAQKIFMATLNFADEIVIKIRNIQPVTNQLLLKAPEAIIATYSLFEPRPVLAGCGLQAVFADRSPARFIATLFPYSLAEFATFGPSEDQYGPLEIHCEGCGTTYNRTPGQLEKSCRFCGGKKGIVC